MARKRSVHRPKINYDGRALVDAHGPHTPVRGIIHDTEGHDEKGIDDLRGVAVYWHKQSLGYGAQIGVDAEGNSALYVNLNEVAWHTGKHNTGSIGVEQVGYASFSRHIWIHRRKQLRKVAKWMAYCKKEYGIPLVWDLDHGWATHRMFSKAFPQDTTHTDPGLFFPKRLVMRLAKWFYEHGW